jgi:FKBP-type peptidyl-prolyl cis-trans isomerase
MNHRVAAAESGSIQTETGLVYKETVTGTGIVPTQLDTVEVHYVGRLIDGTVFDSSIARGYASSINVPHSMMM